LHSLIQPPEDNYKTFINATTISTYPLNAPKTKREGDPICDSYCVQVYNNNRVIIGLADGCNWGFRPFQASHKASEGFCTYMNQYQAALPDLKETGQILLRAVSHAHNCIIDGFEDVWDAGSTTLMGGILLEIDQTAEESDSSDPKYCFCVVSVGDCKAFHFNIKTGVLVDITEGNRTNLTDPTDPGGRIGPYLNEGSPDLRNLDLYVEGCSEGDFILCVTDGIHDNFDPQLLGLQPKDLKIGLTQSAEMTWSEAENAIPDDVDSAKSKYRCKLIEKEINRANKSNDWSKVTCSDISQSVLEYCSKLTQSTRDFMQSNPGKRQPNDYVNFPGKTDHSTIVVTKVGCFD